MSNLNLLLSAVEYGGYISVVKLIIFLVLFFPWLLLLSWVYEDAESVGTKQDFWTGIVFGSGALALLIWLMMPVFAIGVLLYFIAVGATAISYVMHRNTKVPDFNKVLTADHIRTLFVNEEKKLEVLKSFVFITANNNEVPMPESKTPDFFGYKIAHEILSDAEWRRASDIVFSPRQQEYSVTYYVDGAAIKQPSIVRDQMEYFIHFVKNLAGLETSEKRKPQKGSFRVFQNKVNNYWEVATAGSTAGEQVRLKHVTRENITTLAELGLQGEQLKQLSGIRESGRGLFIVAGPKKSGVTTTFYSLIRGHDAFINSVNTLEKKPTMELDNITQNTFALSDTGTTTYGKKLQALVRMEPDIVGVAECEEPEAAKVACQAVVDEKLIYVTFESENVIQALGKWFKLVGNRALAVDTLLGVSNQRLLRRLCEECKEPYEPNKDILKKFNIPADKAKVFHRAGKVQYDKHGKPSTCEHCQGTGYVGRMGIFEIIMMNGELREAVKQAKSLSEISTHFRRAKMLYLQEQALKQVINGTTSVNEMVRVLSGSQKKKARPAPKK